MKLALHVRNLKKQGELFLVVLRSSNQELLSQMYLVDFSFWGKEKTITFHPQISINFYLRPGFANIK